VMVIQAGAARTALATRPDDARTALAAIERTGRQAMTDMRRMLDILGEGGAAGTGATEAGLEPMPDLGRLGELVDEVRGAGMPVTLRIDGTPPPIERGVGLSAYRIVQESLTNALKHASGARAEVVVRYGPRSVDLQITDEGGAARPDLAAGGGGSGRGLVGMRERVALYGGTLEAGPTSTGFRVVARLPVEASPGPSPDPVSS
jgi:signal transduction histidine kinase